MKIICSKDTLIEYVNIAVKTAAAKSTRKVLECVLFETTDDGVILTTYNEEMGIKTAPFEANIVRPGSVALEAKLLTEIIRKMPEGDITIDCGESCVTLLTNKKAKFKIIGIEAESFPDFPEVVEKKSITIRQSELKDLIQKTSFAIAVSHTNVTFTGALLEYKNNYLNMVCIDGFRIALSRVMLEGSEDADVIVPGKAITELAKIIESGKEKIKIIFSDKNVIFQTNKFTFLSNIISGLFFNYNQSFNVDLSMATNALINTNSFISSLERCVLLSMEMSVKPVILRFESKLLYISIQTENGTLNEEIEIDMEGEPLEIAFNPKYLLDSLKSINCDEVNFYLTGSLSGCIIKKGDNEDTKYFVLPLKI